VSEEFIGSWNFCTSQAQHFFYMENVH